MPELKLGIKHECFNCGTKFYDLGKAEAICPKCGADQKNASKTESPAATQASRRKRKAEVAKAIVVEEEEAIVEAPDDELDAPEPEGTEAEEVEKEDIDDED